MLRILLLTLMCIAMLGSAVAQHAVKGTVVSAADGAGLPGVAVSEKGTTNGTLTDMNGQFAIRTASAKSTLVFSFIGMTKVEEPLNGRSVVDVKMVSEEFAIGEVVITGLGIKRDKKSIGYAVQQLKAEEVILSAPVDIAQGLQGKVAGLNISTSNGLDNASSRIVIRGNNSLFGNNQPIIVVDGAILDNKSLPQGNTETSLGGYQDWGNYLSYMNMDNVETISVLKGPNAAALYGARGANGVILITSKKGMVKKGIGVDYNHTSSFTNATRFMDIQNEYGGGFAGALWSANVKLPKTKTGENYVPTLYPSGWNGNPLAAGGSGVESIHGPVPGGYNTWDIFSWFGASSSWGPKLDGTMARWWDGSELCIEWQNL